MAIILREDKGSALSHTEMDANFNALDKIPDGKVFPSDKTKGIKLDTNNPVWGWKDIVGFIYLDPQDPNAASFSSYRGGIKAYSFVEGKECFVDFHMPHDYAMGTPIYMHVHWSHNSSVVTGGSVTWAFEIMYSKGHGQEAFNTPVIVSVVQNASSVQHMHMVAESIASSNGGSEVSLNTNTLEVDGIIQCRLYLDSNDITTSDASTVTPFAHFVDIHYQSTNLPTKNKNPDFWA